MHRLESLATPQYIVTRFAELILFASAVFLVSLDFVRLTSSVPWRDFTKSRVTNK